MNNTQCILDALKIATDTKAFELGEGVLHRAPALFKEYFPNRKAVIVADNNTWKAAGEAVDASMREAGIPCERFLIEEEEFHADWPYVERIDEMLDRTGAVAVAVGARLRHVHRDAVRLHRPVPDLRRRRLHARAVWLSS